MVITKVKRMKGQVTDIQRVVDSFAYCNKRCPECAKLGIIAGCNRVSGHTDIHHCSNENQGPHEWNAP